MNPHSKVDEKGNRKVQCRICEKWYHRLEIHISKIHTQTVGDVEGYKRKFPGAPTISEHASKRASRGQKKAAKKRPKPAKKAQPASGMHHVGVARLKIREGLKAEDQTFVPEHDSDWQMGETERDMWEALALGIEENENVLLFGPTGCGKSAGVTQLAAALNQPVRRVNMHGDFRAADFLGEKVVDVHEESGQAIVIWRDGICPDAARRGHWLLIDELDATPPQILFALQALLEKGGRIVLTGNQGEVIEPHPNFRIIATANTIGRGDDAGLYAGTNMLNEAFLDRFGIVISCEYPAEDAEVNILTQKTGVTESTARKMVRAARHVREAFTREEVFCTFSTRRLIAWASKAVRFRNPEKAAKYTILNKLAHDDREVVKGVLQRYFGGSV